MRETKHESELNGRAAAQPDESMSDDGDQASSPPAAAASSQQRAAASSAKIDHDALSIYIGNVDYSASEEELRNTFMACGEIVRVTIIKNMKTGHPKGAAFIEFTDKGGVEQAMQLNGKEVKGRPLIVTSKKPRPEHRAPRSAAPHHHHHQPPAHPPHQRPQHHHSATRHPAPLAPPPHQPHYPPSYASRGGYASSRGGHFYQGAAYDPRRNGTPAAHHPPHPHAAAPPAHHHSSQHHHHHPPTVHMQPAPRYDPYRRPDFYDPYMTNAARSAGGNMTQQQPHAYYQQHPHDKMGGMRSSQPMQQQQHPQQHQPQRYSQQQQHFGAPRR
jgi:hypothetical protein